MAWMQRERRQNGYLSSAARTSHETPTTIDASRARGIKVYVDITDFTGTSITFHVDAVDPGSTGTVTQGILASAAKTGTGAFTLTIDPGVETVSNVSLRDVVQRFVQIRTTGTITSVTYEINYELLA